MVSLRRLELGITFFFFVLPAIEVSLSLIKSALQLFNSHRRLRACAVWLFFAAESVAGVVLTSVLAVTVLDELRSEQPFKYSIFVKLTVVVTCLTEYGVICTEWVLIRSRLSSNGSPEVESGEKRRTVAKYVAFIFGLAAIVCAILDASFVRWNGWKVFRAISILLLVFHISILFFSVFCCGLLNARACFAFTVLLCTVIFAIVMVLSGWLWKLQANAESSTASVSKFEFPLSVYFSFPVAVLGVILLVLGAWGARFSSEKDLRESQVVMLEIGALALSGPVSVIGMTPSSALMAKRFLFTLLPEGGVILFPFSLSLLFIIWQRQRPDIEDVEG